MDILMCLSESVKEEGKEIVWAFKGQRKDKLHFQMVYPQSQNFSSCQQGGYYFGLKCLRLLSWNCSYIAQDKTIEKSCIYTNISECTIETSWDNLNIISKFVIHMQIWLAYYSWETSFFIIILHHIVLFKWANET